MLKFFLTCFLLLVCTIFTNAQSDSLSCRRYTTGEFIYVNDEGQEIHVSRKKKVQKEYNRTQNVSTRFRINWTSGCSYELKQVWSDSKHLRKSNGSVTTVIISSAAESSYLFECGCKGLEVKKKGIMIRKS